MYNRLRGREGARRPTDAHDREVPAGAHKGTARDFLNRHERESAIAADGSKKDKATFSACLLARAADHRNIKLALDHIVAKGGDAPGPNGVRPSDLSPSTRWELARSLSKAIRRGTYRPGPGRTLKISKGPGRGHRTITVLDVEDRAVQRAVVQVLQPFVDPSFQDTSFGFRPKKNRDDALAWAEARATASGLWTWVVADVKDAFDRVPRRRLMDILRLRAPAADFLTLVETVIGNTQGRGLVQGGALSPLLLNVYLDHFLDRPWRKAHPETPLVRVADDLLILAESPEQAAAKREELAVLLRAAGMTLNEAKDVRADLAAGQSIEWLGYAIRMKDGGGVTARLTERNWERLEEALAGTHDKPDAPIRALETIDGWIDQAGPCYRHDDVNEVHARIERIARTYAFEELPTREDVRARWERAYEQWNQKRKSEKGRHARLTNSAAPAARRTPTAVTGRRGAPPRDTSPDSARTSENGHVVAIVGPPVGQRSRIRRPAHGAGRSKAGRHEIDGAIGSSPCPQPPGPERSSTRSAARTTVGVDSANEQPGGESMRGPDVSAIRPKVRRRRAGDTSHALDEAAKATNHSTTKRSAARGGGTSAPRAEPGADSRSKESESGSPRGSKTTAPVTPERTRKARTAKRGRTKLRSTPIREEVPDTRDLARQIRKSHKCAIAAHRSSLRHAVETGRLLLEVKELVGHGQFTKWLKNNCGAISPRTARAYMQAAGTPNILERLDDPKRQSTADLTLASCLKGLARPRTQRELPDLATKSGNATRVDHSEPLPDMNADADPPTQGLGGRSAQRRKHDREPADRSDLSTPNAGSRALASTTGLDHGAATSGKAGQGEDDDARWLETIPLRARLADPSVFDDEAILWRRFQPMFEQMANLRRPSPEDVKTSWIDTRYKERFVYLVAASASVLPPEKWRLCRACNGKCLVASSGRGGSKKTTCNSCKGAGYFLSHPADLINPRDEDDDDE